MRDRSIFSSICIGHFRARRPQLKMRDYDKPNHHTRMDNINFHYRLFVYSGIGWAVVAVIASMWNTL